MNFERIEDVVKERLEAIALPVIPDLKIEVEPEYEAENKPVVTKPRVTIFLAGSEFDKTKSTQYIAQDEDIKMILLVRCRKVRGDGGVYQILEEIRRALVGYIPAGVSKIWMSKIDFDNRDNGIWSYTVTIGMRGKIVEEEITNPPLFKSLTADFDDNNFNN